MQCFGRPWAWPELRLQQRQQRRRCPRVTGARRGCCGSVTDSVFSCCTCLLSVAPDHTHSTTGTVKQHHSLGRMKTLTHVSCCACPRAAAHLEPFMVSSSASQPSSESTAMASAASDERSDGSCQRLAAKKGGMSQIRGASSRNPAVIICTDMAVGFAHSKQPGRWAVPHCPAVKRQLGAKLTRPGSHGGGCRAATASRRPACNAQRHHLQLLLQEAGAQVRRLRSDLRSTRAPCTRSELHAPLQSMLYWPCRT